MNFKTRTYNNDKLATDALGPQVPLHPVCGLDDEHDAVVGAAALLPPNVNVYCGRLLAWRCTMLAVGARVQLQDMDIAEMKN